MTARVLSVLLFAASPAAAYVSASNDVTTTFLTVDLGGRTQRVRLFRPAMVTGAPVVFVSGDGPWVWMPPRVCRGLAAAGHVVVGLSGHDYLVHQATHKKPLTVERIQGDFVRLLRAAADADPGHRKPALVGWSLGAGYGMIAAASDAVRANCSLVVPIGLTEKDELAWRAIDTITWLTGGDAHEPSIEIGPYAARVAGVPVCLIQGDTDRYAPFDGAQRVYDAVPGRKRLVRLQRTGHLFHSKKEQAALLSALDDALRWAASPSDVAAQP
jgi:pimeloyl-ACP methyl ester carboxylesterase